MEQYGRFAQVYDLFMSDVDYNEWAEYLAGFIEPGSTVIECGCGTGQLTLRLKKKGYDISGTDISTDMLDVASERARSEGLKINFAHMDMTSLEWHKRVDCIVAPCDCVNYLTGKNEAEDFMRASYRTLKPGGILLFDVSSRYKLREIIGFNTFADSRPNAAYIWQNYFDEKTNLSEMNLEFFVFSGVEKNGKQLFERFRERHVQYAYTESELKELLIKAGFSDINCWNAFTKEKPKFDSERLQFFARKPA